MAASKVVKSMLDTTIYIEYFSYGTEPSEIVKGHLYVSAVVMEELYAGASTFKAVKDLDRLYKTMESVGRLVTPTAEDWRQSGQILTKIAKKFGYEEIGRGRLTNDVLIAICARRIGAVLFTRNLVDFKRIKEFLDFKVVPV